MLLAAAKTTECPEARARLRALTVRATIRELDGLASAGEYEYPLSGDLWAYSPDPKGPPEFYAEDFYYMWDLYLQSKCGTTVGGFNKFCEPHQRHRTRAALILYVTRTNDWDTARRILRWKKSN